MAGFAVPVPSQKHNISINHALAFIVQSYGYLIPRNLEIGGHI
jgi:hypothetical protein